jgi:hypothetical protein
MHTQTWKVRIEIDEDDTRTCAHAVLSSRDGLQVRGEGEARRRPTDAVIPEIGEELAVSRAMYGLADKLMDAAAKDLDMLSHPA